MYLQPEFLCVCADAYQCYTCVEAIVLTMLFNPNLNVPDNLREKQLKDCQRVKLVNPFTTRRVKEKTTKEQQAVEAANWKPKFFVLSRPRRQAVQSPWQWRSPGLNGPQPHRCRQPTRKRF